MNFYSSSIITALTILQRKSEYSFFTPARVLGRRAARWRGGTSAARVVLRARRPPYWAVLVVRGTGRQRIRNRGTAGTAK